MSTFADEQALSYETQCAYYTDVIMKNPEYRLAGIFADEGITGTSTTKRKDFQRMIRHCKAGKIDVILTKSISRFARNTVDSLEHVRLLKSMGIGVIFEKEGIDTRNVTNEFLLTIYASLAQAESESISQNVKWGKQRSAKAGKVAISYGSFLGYRRGPDDKPEIVPEEADIVRRIYTEFLVGRSRQQIADALTAERIPTPMRKTIWSSSTVASILRNEKYYGAALLQKTFVSDCISHKVEVNVGQLPQYFVEDSHPAIIDRATWSRVQEELARRGSKRKVKQIGTKTQQGKYSSKYALTELLICGACGTPYRRCTWSKNGQKKIVWRCINRLDFGTKYCKNSPTLEESAVQNAILKAMKDLASLNPTVLETLKTHIEIGLWDTSGESADLLRLQDIEGELAELIALEAQDGNRGNYDTQLERLLSERISLKANLEATQTEERHNENEQVRLAEIFDELGCLRCCYIEWDDVIVRQMIECVRVLSRDKLRICFRLGGEVEVGVN